MASCADIFPYSLGYANFAFIVVDQFAVLMNQPTLKARFLTSVDRSIILTHWQVPVEFCWKKCEGCCRFRETPAWCWEVCKYLPEEHSTHLFRSCWKRKVACGLWKEPWFTSLDALHCRSAPHDIFMTQLWFGVGCELWCSQSIVSSWNTNPDDDDDDY
jgi:hypothetical protein